MLSMALGLDSASQVYLACGATDMRKSIDGLAALVGHSFELDPCSPSLFVFCNRDHNKLKILFWQHNGFWLFYRRLERGRFRWPDKGESQTLCVDRRQLQWLLDGLELQQQRAHLAVSARIIA